MTSSNAPPGPLAGFRRWRDPALIGALLVAVLLGLASLASATGWAEIWAHIQELSPQLVLCLLGLSLINYLLRGVRWHLCARAIGLPTRLGQDMRHFLGGFAMTVTPGRVGELIRMRWLRRETGWSFDRTAPLVLVDRAADLAAMAAILALALTLSSTGIAGAIPVALVAVGAAWIATRPKLLAALVTMLYRGVGRWPRLFGRLRQAAKSLTQFSNARVLAPALALGAVGWLAEGYALHLILVAMGLDIGLWTAIAIFVFATLAGGLTGAPGGLGGAEAAMVALLGLQGVPLEISLPATAVIRLTTLWFAILVGMIVFPWAEARSKRAADALQ